MLLASFVVVGIASCLSLLRAADDRYNSDARTHLVSIAKLIAAQIDPQKHELLALSGQINTDSYRRQLAPLSRAKDILPEIRFVRTLRQVEERTVTVLASPPLGETVRGASNIPASANMTSTMKSVFLEGRAKAEPDFSINLGAKSLSAYAPILNQDGRVVAILGVDQDAGTVLGHLAILHKIGQVTVILVLVFGVALSLIFTRTQLKGHGEGRGQKWPLASGRSVRRAIMEAILFLLVCFLFVTGTTGFMSQRATQHELTGSMDRSQELERVRQSAEHMLVTQKVDTEAILSLAHQIKMAGLQGISLQDLNSNLKHEAIGGILSRLKGESDFETQHRRELQERVNEQIEGLVAMFAIASLLSLSSLVLLRSAARREADLESARDDAVRHQDRYKQVAENLPIGFFTFSQNQFEYTNSAWDSMTNRQPDQGPWDAFMNAIHPDDMKFVKTTLTRAEKDSTPFSLSFKMKIQQKQDRYFEARGVPIFDGQGRVEHFVGFVNDVTTQVASQSQLEEKNQEIESSNFMLRQALRVLEENFEAMVHSLVKVVEAKDPYTAGHSERVMGYSVMIAEDLGLDESSVRTVKMGSLIHDIGKIGIPDSILTKPNGLSDAEYALIRQHPVIGARMVESIPSFQACLPIVMSHHERLDGKGYPDCLVANQLSLFVRIVTVADCFDAMTSNRAYRIGLPVVEAIAELRKEVDSGGLDGKIVETLADIVSKGGLLWSEPYSKAA